MRLLIAVSVLLMSCATAGKRPVEFHPKEIGSDKDEAVFVCYQDGESDKLTCVDFKAFMESLAREGQPTGHQSL